MEIIPETSPEKHINPLQLFFLVVSLESHKQN